MRMKCTNSYITWIKRAAAAAMAAVLMLSATACAEEDALSAVASVPVAKELEMNEEAVASGTVTEDKGVLTFAMKKPVDSFFPLGEMDEDLSNVFSMIFEPAVRVSAAAKFEPSIVESWETSSDGTTYTFKVRDGVAFHGDNGTVTAADLAYALNWILGGRVTIETLSGDDTTESEPAEKDVQGQAYEGEEEAGVGVAGMAQDVYKRQVFGRVIKFAMSSLICTGIDYLLYCVLKIWLPVGWSYALARVVSASVNYQLSRRVVFHGKPSIWSFIGYFALAAACMLIGSFGVSWLTSLGVNSVVAKLIFDCSLFVMNYFVQKKIIFRNREG